MTIACGQRTGSIVAIMAMALIQVALCASGALAAEPYVGFWAEKPEDCASKTVPPLTQVEAGAAYWGQFFCPSATFTPDGASWLVHVECADPMAGPGDEGDSFDYRFTVDGDTLHWDPVGEGTGSVLHRCPA